MNNLTINHWIQLTEVTKNGVTSFQEAIKSHEGNQVKLKGFRSAFTLVDNTLVRGGRVLTITGVNKDS